jgi:hypothetical protein
MMAGEQHLLYLARDLRGLKPAATKLGPGAPTKTATFLVKNRWPGSLAVTQMPPRPGQVRALGLRAQTVGISIVVQTDLRCKEQ